MDRFSHGYAGGAAVGTAIVAAPQRAAPRRGAARQPAPARRRPAEASGERPLAERRIKFALGRARVAGVGDRRTATRLGTFRRARRARHSRTGEENSARARRQIASSAASRADAPAASTSVRPPAKTEPGAHPVRYDSARLKALSAPRRLTTRRVRPPRDRCAARRALAHCASDRRSVVEAVEHTHTSWPAARAPWSARLSSPPGRQEVSAPAAPAPRRLAGLGRLFVCEEVPCSPRCDLD